MTTAAANGRPQPGRGPSPDSLPAGDELRLLIREVLTDVLPALRGRLAASGATVPPYAPPPAAAPDLLPPAAASPYAPPPGPPPPAVSSLAIPAGTIADADARPPATGATLPPSTLMGGLMFTSEHQTAHQPGGDSVGTRHAAPGAAGRGAAVRQVRLETDEDVRKFALDIMRLAGNPARRADLIAGRLAFTLAGAPAAAARPEHRVDAGAVTERAVQAAAKAGQRLVLGPRAVLTPLARDRALALGVPIEKER